MPKSRRTRRSKRSKSGYIGVVKITSGKYKAQIQIDHLILAKHLYILDNLLYLLLLALVLIVLSFHLFYHSLSYFFHCETWITLHLRCVRFSKSITSGRSNGTVMTAVDRFWIMCIAGWTIFVGSTTFYLATNAGTSSFKRRKTEKKTTTKASMMMQ